jgi:hypothetical protein
MENTENKIEINVVFKSEPDEPKYIVSDICFAYEENQIKANCGILSLLMPNKTSCWMWKTDLKSFEVVHGTSRVVKLIPDKLASAIIINHGTRNELHPDNGVFFVNLVTNLASEFMNLIHKPEPQPNRWGSLRTSFGPDKALSTPLPETQQSLEDNLKNLITSLNNFKEKLINEEPPADLFQAALPILNMSENLLLLCEAYMKYIHPVWLSMDRTGLIDTGVVHNKRQATLEKHKADNDSLTRQFKHIYLEYFSTKRSSAG